MRTPARVTLRGGLLELSITGREAVVVDRAGDDWTFEVDEAGAPFGVIPPGRWYPEHAPRLPLESACDYTNRLLAGGVYDHRRGRQCSIGWHRECSDPSGLRCQCPCHREEGGRHA